MPPSEFDSANRETGRIATGPIETGPIETIIALFLDRVSHSGPRPAIHTKQAGEYRSRCWNELAQDVFGLASVLVTSNIEPGDRVAQWSENRYEWIVADLATQACQAIHVPLHAPLSGAQAVYQINHSGAKAILLSGSSQLDKLQPIASELPNDLQVLTHDPLDVLLAGKPVSHWRSLVTEDGPHVGSQIAERSRQATTADSIATILYTSGTTGEPKGVTLTQRNVISNVLGVLETFDENESDMRLCFLPLSHIFARTCDLYTWIGSGSQFALAESRETIVADCQRIQPTIINGVPYFYEKMHHGLTAAGTEDTPGALREMLGGKLRACCSGGAALPNHTFDFFQKQALAILQGYGLTETAPVLTMSTVEHCKRGMVGPPLVDVSIRIAADGEILARGPNIMLGYWNDEAATADAIVDDWFHTGDLGELDDDGYLKITGRKKELIVTATGKNIAPSLLESLLCRDPLIEQAMVLGDDKKYLAALIVPDRDQLRAELDKRGMTLDDPQASPLDAEVSPIFEERIRHQLRELSHHEQVRSFILLDRGFTIDAGHLTPKASLRREVIARDFADVIARLFAS